MVGVLSLVKKEGNRFQSPSLCKQLCERVLNHIQFSMLIGIRSMFVGMQILDVNPR